MCIVDPEKLVDVDPGAAGVSCSRAVPEMFVGYSSTPRSTPTRSPRRALEFRTGDLARADGDTLTIVDRLEGRDHPRRREHLRAGGRSAARHAPAGDRGRVRCCARSGDVGEVVCAFVIADPGTDPTLEAASARILVEQGLARFKLPSRLEIRTDLPRTASGKVQKGLLRTELSAVAP